MKLQLQDTLVLPSSLPYDLWHKGSVTSALFKMSHFTGHWAVCSKFNQLMTKKPSKLYTVLLCLSLGLTWMKVHINYSTEFNWSKLNIWQESFMTWAFKILIIWILVMGYHMCKWCWSKQIYFPWFDIHLWNHFWQRLMQLSYQIPQHWSSYWNMPKVGSATPDMSWRHHVYCCHCHTLWNAMWML